LFAEDAKKAINNQLSELSEKNKNVTIDFQNGADPVEQFKSQVDLSTTKVELAHYEIKKIIPVKKVVTPSVTSEQQEQEIPQVVTPPPASEQPDSESKTPTESADDINYD
jgi:uncharacterized coiled-coil DUF342 family protein